MVKSTQPIHLSKGYEQTVIIQTPLIAYATQMRYCQQSAKELDLHKAQKSLCRQLRTKSKVCY